MPHKKKRKRDHHQPDLQWEKCSRRLKRIHSSEYVQKNWEHLLVIHPGNNAADAAAYAAQPALVPRHRTDIKWLDQEGCRWVEQSPSDPRKAQHLQAG